MKYTSSKTISIVAAREIQTALRSKSILISLGIVLVVVVAGAFVGGSILGSDSGAKKLGLVGVEQQAVDATASALSTSSSSEDKGQAGINGAMQGNGGKDKKVETVKIDSREEAEKKVKDDDIAAALVRTENGFELLSNGSPDATIMGVASASVANMSQNEALRTLGVNPEDYAKAMHSAHVETVNLKDKGSSADMTRLVTVLIAVSVMSYFIILFAAAIGSRVTEEKSSRVIEIILATARPFDFLAGKIIGNTVVGFIGTGVILLAGGIAIKASGLADGMNFDYSILALMLLSFLLGMFMFGSLYAAAGSLVSRTEDLQSTQSPILLLVFGMIYAPMFGYSSLDSTIMKVFTWIPPFSLTVSPLQLAAGNISLPMVLLSFALSAVVIVGIVALVSRIYSNSILHNGKKMSWAAAIKG